jgi:hypothetical protein
MDPQQLEALLYEDESTSLDFKRDQYLFAAATDHEKSELLKDILAFANSWRRSDAYILIGVEEIKGGRSKPVGVSAHIDDAALQQFVNAKTNRKVEFAYETAGVDGITIGVIRVPIQARPSYLTKAYGRVSADSVYIRRGSSTEILKPDEIAKMGSQTDLRPPRLELVARVVNVPHFGIIVSIKNGNGAAAARAPRLALRIPGPFVEGESGIDGYGNPGLTRIPQGLDSGYKTYGGDSTCVVSAGIVHDVTFVSYRGQFDQMPDQVALTYQLSAEGIDPIEETLIVRLRP